MAIKPGETIEQDPQSILDYIVNWRGDAADGGPWLESSENIASSTFTLEAGLTNEDDDNDNDTATVWISIDGGAVIGNKYKVTNKITTSVQSPNNLIPRTVERSFYIKVKEK